MIQQPYEDASGTQVAEAQFTFPIPADSIEEAMAKYVDLYQEAGHRKGKELRAQITQHLREQNQPQLVVPGPTANRAVRRSH
ncbi:MAG: hypothetical protein ACLFV3_09190 [Phycisphaeraceae bacterium]